MVDGSELLAQEAVELGAHAVLAKAAALLLFEAVLRGDEVQPLEGTILERAFNILNGELFPACSVHKLDAGLQKPAGFSLDEGLR